MDSRLWHNIKINKPMLEYLNAIVASINLYFHISFNVRRYVHIKIHG